eukprot:SAG22_NODE_142_length_17922_cov_10.990406_15_plen_247_part_00
MQTHPYCTTQYMYVKISLVSKVRQGIQISVPAPACLHLLPRAETLPVGAPGGPSRMPSRPAGGGGMLLRLLRLAMAAAAVAPSVEKRPAPPGSQWDRAWQGPGAAPQAKSNLELLGVHHDHMVVDPPGPAAAAGAALQTGADSGGKKELIPAPAFPAPLVDEGHTARRPGGGSSEFQPPWAQYLADRVKRTDIGADCLPAALLHSVGPGGSPHLPIHRGWTAALAPPYYGSPSRCLRGSLHPLCAL